VKKLAEKVEEESSDINTNELTDMNRDEPANGGENLASPRGSIRNERISLTSTIKQQPETQEELIEKLKHENLSQKKLIESLKSMIKEKDSLIN